MPPLTLPPVDSYELAFDGHTGKALLAAREQRDGRVLWGIFEGSTTCLTAPGTWEWESSPSSRTEEYLERARRPLDEALALWRDHLVVSCAGATWRDAVVSGTPARDCLRVHDPEGIVDRMGDPVDRPRLGSWIRKRTVDAYRPSDDASPDSEISAEIDMAFRRGVALLADRWRSGNRPMATIGTAGTFHDDVAQGLPDHLACSRETVTLLAADLANYLEDGRAFRIGDAVLLASGRAIVATIQDANASDSPPGRMTA